MINFEKEKIRDQLKSLKNLPQVKEVKALKQRLERELERLTEKGKPVILELPIVNKKELANASRSRKGLKYWRLVKLVRDRIPKLSVREIRKQITKRKKTGISDISDAIWENLSG